MKIRILDYTRPQCECASDISKDVIIGGIYEVIDDTYKYDGHKYFKIIDDVGVPHQVLQKDCVVLGEEPTKQASGMCSTKPLQRIQTFTMNHKNLEISFEDGMIILRDWDVRLNQPVDYRCDTIEQLEELMGAWENLCKFKSGE